MRRLSVLIALMASFLAVLVLTLDAAEDTPHLSLITDDKAPAPDVSPEPCCDTPCACTLPWGIPPNCICGDVKDHCYPGCKMCICTRSLPPKCRCHDVLHYCPGPCADSIV